MSVSTPLRRSGAKPRTRAQVIDKIAANFEVSDEGCWLWTGELINSGYARLTWKPLDTIIRGGHRVVLHAIGQPVPAGLVVDHLCRNRDCVNPDHLEPVIQRENIMRSPIAIGASNAAITHCPQGHAYDAANTYVWRHKTKSTTVRICRACSKARAAAYYQARKAAKAVSR